MAKRLKKNYPKMKFIITGDALYATTPVINICKDNGWYYIFNLKKIDLKMSMNNLLIISIIIMKLRKKIITYLKI